MNWKPIDTIPKIPFKDVLIGKYYGNIWLHEIIHFLPLTDNIQELDCTISNPTHWCKIPEPPKKETNDNK